jgi:hypothetical protein
MSCNINVTGGAPAKDQSYNNLAVQNSLVAKRVTAQRIIANSISTSQLITNEADLQQLSYFANDAISEAPAVILTINEVSESFFGTGSAALWPNQFVDGTHWLFDLGPSIALIDGSVGAYLQWSGVFVPEDGVYEFRQYYDSDSPNFGDTNGTFQIFVDGAPASSNTVDFSMALTPSTGGLARFENIVLTEGFHDIQMRCVSGVGAGDVSMIISGLGTLVKVAE